LCQGLEKQQQKDAKFDPWLDLGPFWDGHRFLMERSDQGLEALKGLEKKGPKKNSRIDARSDLRPFWAQKDCSGKGPKNVQNRAQKKDGWSDLGPKAWPPSFLVERARKTGPKRTQKVGPKSKHGWILAELQTNCLVVWQEKSQEGRGDESQHGSGMLLSLACLLACLLILCLIVA
jgi:hypothetical protein